MAAIRVRGLMSVLVTFFVVQPCFAEAFVQEIPSLEAINPASTIATVPKLPVLQSDNKVAVAVEDTTKPSGSAVFENACGDALHKLVESGEFTFNAIDYCRSAYYISFIHNAQLDCQSANNEWATQVFTKILADCMVKVKTERACVDLE